MAGLPAQQTSETISAARRPDSCRRFVAYVAEQAERAAGERRGARWLALTLAHQCANVDFHLLRRPLHFWRALRQEPPVCFGPRGFRGSLADDFHPARHYSAFLMIGYFLPYALAAAFAWLWEAAEGIFLGGYSRCDVALSRIAVRHGNILRRQGPAALAPLILRDLCEPEQAGAQSSG